MPDSSMMISFLTKFNALMGGFFLLVAFGLVTKRQMRACVWIYIMQSVILGMSALDLGLYYCSIHLFVVAFITILIKAFIIPWLLRRTMSMEIYARREISQVLNIPASQIIAFAIAIFAYIVASPLLRSASIFEMVNVPIGLAGLFLGAFTVTVRREALPQLMGILAMENGAFFAGVAIAPDLPLIAELAVAFDVLIIAIVIGILIRTIDEFVGRTTVGEMMSLREE